MTALFWSNINPYGTIRLDMDKRLEPAPAVRVPGPRHVVGDAARTGDSSS
ncbi:hypothetical protein ACFZAR_38195 [Streptomyces sp. NPDC008222]